MKLTDEQVDQYRSNGYLFPLDAFNAPQVEMILAEFAQAQAFASAIGLESEWPRLIRANAQVLTFFSPAQLSARSRFAPKCR